MAVKPNFSLHKRNQGALHGAALGNFSASARSKTKVQRIDKDICDSAFLAERGCLSCVPAPRHAASAS
ncbi:MAG TPA: hypothetical protein VF865_16180 [Acidobacteriaceae bacterium]